MNFYQLIDTLKQLTEGNDLTNKITFGELSDVNLSKDDTFPLLHMMVEEAVIEERTIDYRIVVVAADMVDHIDEDLGLEDFYGNDNTQDVLNTQFAVVNGLQSALRRGELFSDLYQIDTDYTANLFEDRFENLLAGWSLNISITVANNQISDINANGQSAC